MAEMPAGGPVNRQEEWYCWIAENMEGGGSGVIEELNVTENGIYEVPEGVDGYNPVNVQVASTPPVIRELNVTENGTYHVPQDADGYGPVVVAVAPPVIQSVTFTENGVYALPAGVDGYGPVTVSVAMSGLRAEGTGTYDFAGDLASGNIAFSSSVTAALNG